MTRVEYPMVYCPRPAGQHCKGAEWQRARRHWWERALGVIATWRCGSCGARLRRWSL